MKTYEDTGVYTLDSDLLKLHSPEKHETISERVINYEAIQDKSQKIQITGYHVYATHASQIA